MTIRRDPRHGSPGVLPVDDRGVVPGLMAGPALAVRVGVLGRADLARELPAVRAVGLGGVSSPAWPSTANHGCLYRQSKSPPETTGRDHP